MASIGITSFLLIGVIAILIFAPKKLPELARAFGTTFQQFKKGTHTLMDEADQKENQDK